jgi:hypothetical protein
MLAMPRHSDSMLKECRSHAARTHSRIFVTLSELSKEDAEQKLQDEYYVEDLMDELAHSSDRKNSRYSPYSKSISNAKLGSLLLRRQLELCVKDERISLRPSLRERMCKTHGERRVAEEIASLIKLGLISFPWRKYNLDPVAMFKRLLEYKAVTTDQQYEFRERGAWRSGEFVFQKFKGTFVNFVSVEQDYELIDGITDYFQEQQRLHAHRRGFDNPIEHFERNSAQVVLYAMRDRNAPINAHTLREAVWKCTKECTMFKVCLVQSLLSYFNCKNYLDFSAGWGDRLIGAMACKTLESYFALDPNLDLKPGHDQIIETFLELSEQNKTEPRTRPRSRSVALTLNSGNATRTRAIPDRIRAGTGFRFVEARQNV